MKRHRSPVAALLVWLIRGYQIFVSPLLPRSCKYYPSCSQYAVDALSQYGIFRGSVLAVWRLLRCNPFSLGGYDPVERQKLFRGRGVVRRQERNASFGWRVSVGKLGRPTVALLLVVVLALIPVTLSSCSFLGDTTSATEGTTSTGDAETGGGAAVSDGVSGSDDTSGSAATTTSTTTAEEATPGSFDRLFKPLEALFFSVLDFFHENLHVSWSWAIVLLTVVVRIVLIPLTWRQIKSMRAMQSLQPHLKALQEKYKDDRQLLNQKVMEFYRENNVSPFGSCLPLLLQLPVFLGLFYMLRTAGRPDLDPAEWGRWASVFVDPQVGWLWISDITKFNVGLMFLYIGTQFVASWQTARKGAGQQKIIAYFMPIMIGIFMYIYKWPAGLFIYWVTSNVWTIAQQLVLEKVVPAPVPVAAPEKGKGGSGKAAARTGGKAGAKSPAKASGKASTPAKKKTTSGRPTGKTSAKPSGKSGGKSSGQRSKQQGKAAGGKGRR